MKGGSAISAVKRIALVGAVGPQLDHPLAVLEDKVAAAREIGEQAGDLVLPFRRLAEMDGDSGRLVLDEQAGPPGREARDRGPYLREIHGRRMRKDAAVGQPQLEPVRARHGEAGAAEMALEIGERAAAEDRDAARRAGRRGARAVGKRRRHRDQVRRLGQLDQGPVEIQEQGCVRGETGRRRVRLDHHARDGAALRETQAAASRSAEDRLIFGAGRALRRSGR